jgi:type I restriction enzyme S subunit
MTTATHPNSPFVKPSGINTSSWTMVGPDHWERKRLKFLCGVNPTRSTNLRNGAPGTVSFLPMELAREDSPHFEATDRLFAEVSNGFTSFADGDVLVAKITPCFENGKGGICSNLTGGIGFGSTEFHVLRPSQQISAKYLYYVTHSKPFREIGAGQMKGSAGQQRVPTDYLSEFVLPYPSRDEQDAIVAFLDRRLADIDRLVSNKRKLIELLDEELQRSVFDVVTHGLESSRTLKPSGVDWIPQIPKTWTMRRNGTLFDERKQKGREELPVLMVSINTGVTLDRPNEVREQRQIEDKEKYAFAAKGDIAFNMMRMWQGAVGVVPVDGNVSPAYIVCKPRPAVDAEYYELLFRTKLYQGEVFCRSYGIVPDRNRLYWIGFKSIYSPYPPFDEQQRIVTHVREMRAEVETAKAKALREIELMNEFRGSLVAEAITGRLAIA